ncbi:DUF5376 domain-containing protein [Pasteurella multocida]|uniref:UPF0275 protein PM0505 n=1 Tax=Pasteurella multocida (strain Pm70) TaxID=272843 RepID=Y505_PASMU|nr:DUF5376 domain-containing protein [Pasteurella multocida]Q9CNC7.1 RecName: Full=UPF0275 protein PM0505 [Pasteurella multocida subsp. multocida str. Pm70]AAK02589.1 unknown [Pasteurella multocida subsp. multocida str. Pm70]APW55106.1 hypothetical protein PMCN07_0521 [Pasteurella multocida subsp. multocida str. HN07]ARA69330.1 hypothetical protein BTV67_01750 [Pasteurella multocida subsp. multocida]ARA88858.1 hypothetical protein BTV66_04260 [Pasteurella multocida subsp. septica]AUL53165.1 h
MKVLFSYGTYNNRPYKACGVYESDNRENDGVITDYLSTIPDSYADNGFKVLAAVKDPTITREWIDSQAFEALIEHDQIKVGFYLLDDMEEEDIPDDVDERDTDPRFIPRKEFAYLLEKWLDFYHRPITDMNYQEIIDTKDAY